MGGVRDVCEFTDIKLAKLEEPGIHHSPDAILVKLSDGSTVGHVPDTFACVLASMLDGGQVTHMEGTTTSVPRSAPEGVWVPGGGIEIPCECVLVGVRKDHSVTN